jgi:hypothetical protein
MRRAFTILLTSLFAVPLPAQQGQQQVQQVECRDMATTGNYVAPNETIINGKACRPAGTPSQVVDSAQTTGKPAPAPIVSQAQPAATVADPASGSSASTSTPAPSDQTPKAIVLEDGTPVNLVLDENVSSSDAVTGQTIAFETVDDILVNGFVVIPRGSTAWATVTDAQHKRRMGRAGHVDLNIDKVRLADGEKVLLRAVKNSEGGSNTVKMVGAMAVTAIFTLGGSALFLLAHGKDTTIPKGTNVTAFIQGNVTLDQSKFQRQAVAQQSN